MDVQRKTIAIPARKAARQLHQVEQTVKPNAAQQIIATWLHIKVIFPVQNFLKKTSWQALVGAVRQPNYDTLGPF